MSSTSNSTAKFRVPDFDCKIQHISSYGINGVTYDLPRIIVMPEEKYVWLNIPNVWIEENEACQIENSHHPNLPGFDPEKRIWEILDALTVEEVIHLIAESFCDRSPSLAYIPALKEMDMNMLKNEFQRYGFPGLHHSYFVMPKNKNAMNAWDYNRNQLRVDTYTI